MNKTEVRAVKKYLKKKATTRLEIQDYMIKILAEDCPFYATVRKYTAEFKWGRDSTKDDPQSGRPKTSTLDKQVDAIHSVVWDNKRLTIQQVVEYIGTSPGLVYAVLTEMLGTGKLSAKLNSQILTQEQKLKGGDIFGTYLNRFQANPNRFHRRLVTQNVTGLTIPNLNQRFKATKENPLVLHLRISSC